MHFQIVNLRTCDNEWHDKRERKTQDGRAEGRDSDIIFICSKKINLSCACSRKGRTEVTVIWPETGQDETRTTTRAKVSLPMVNTTEIHAITMASPSLLLSSEQPSLPSM